MKRAKDTPAAPVTPVPDPATLLLDLQRSLGNQAVCRLVRAGPMAVQREVKPGRFNVVGETHDISGTPERREEEMQKLAQDPFFFSEEEYWTEEEFTYRHGGTEKLGDSPEVRMLHSAVMLCRYLGHAKDEIPGVMKPDDPRVALGKLVDELEKVNHEAVELSLDGVRVAEYNPESPLLGPAERVQEAIPESLTTQVGELQAAYEDAESSARKVDARKAHHVTRQSLIKAVGDGIAAAQAELVKVLTDAGYDIRKDVDALDTEVTTRRSDHMHEAAAQAAQQGGMGVWKIGDIHAGDLAKIDGEKSYMLTTKDEFNKQFGFPAG